MNLIDFVIAGRGLERKEAIKQQDKRKGENIEHRKNEMLMKTAFDAVRHIL